MEYNALFGLMPEKICSLSYEDNTLLISADCNKTHHLTNNDNDDGIDIRMNGNYTTSSSNHSLICPCCTICCSMEYGCEN